MSDIKGASAHIMMRHEGLEVNRLYLSSIIEVERSETRGVFYMNILGLTGPDDERRNNGCRVSMYKEHVKALRDRLNEILEDERMDRIEFSCCNCNFGTFSVPYEDVIDSTGIRDPIPPSGWRTKKHNYGISFICPSCIVDNDRYSKMKAYHEFSEFVSGYPSTYSESELTSIRMDAEDVIKACDRVLDGLKRWAKEDERMTEIVRTIDQIKSLVDKAEKIIKAQEINKEDADGNDYEYYKHQFEMLRDEYRILDDTLRCYKLVYGADVMKHYNTSRTPEQNAMDYLLHYAPRMPCTNMPIVPKEEEPGADERMDSWIMIDGLIAESDEHH